MSRLKLAAIVTLLILGICVYTMSWLIGVNQVRQAVESRDAEIKQLLEEMN